MRSLSYRVRMWNYRRHWYRKAMAAWDKPPNDYQLLRFWQDLKQNSPSVKEH